MSDVKILFRSPTLFRYNYNILLPLRLVLLHVNCSLGPIFYDSGISNIWGLQCNPGLNFTASSIAGGSTNLYNCFGNQYGGFSENLESIYLKIQQYLSLRSYPKDAHS